MKHNPQDILAELYHIDPGFKKHAKELQVLIERLTSSNPHIEMNSDFSEDLRNQLIKRARQLTASKKESGDSKFTAFFKTFFMPFTGGILATLLLISLVNPAIIPHPTHPEAIAQIEQRVKEVDASLKTCVKTELPILNQTAKTGSVTFYHKPKGLQKMKEELLGETGKVVNKYYFDHEKLVYVIHEEHLYNRPIYWDETMAKAHGETEVFDEEKSAILTTTYYFDEKGQAINTSHEVDQTLQGQYLLHRSQELVGRYEASKKEVQ